MRLDHVTDLLSPYLDGQLTPGELQVVEDHLAECSRCTEELESLREVVTLVRQLPQQPLPRSFSIGPRPAMRPPALRGDFAGYIRALSSIAAAVLFLAIGLNWAIAGPPQRTSAASASIAQTAAAAPGGAAVQARPPQAVAPAAGAPARAAAPAASAPARAANAPGAAPAGKAVTQPANQPSGGAGLSAQPAPAAPLAQSLHRELNVPLFVAELVAMLLGLAVASYALARWWRA